jgi:hypothetical protein
MVAIVSLMKLLFELIAESLAARSLYVTLGDHALTH